MDGIGQRLKRITPSEFIAAIVTGIGFMGGFPQAPRIFTRTMFQYPILQWFMVYLLVWQGGGAKDPVLSGAATAGLWLVTSIFQ